MNYPLATSSQLDEEGPLAFRCWAVSDLQSRFGGPRNDADEEADGLCVCTQLADIDVLI
jgi:hypothetical protein